MTLSLTIYLPLIFAVLVLFIPGSRPGLVRKIGFSAAALTFLISLDLLTAYDPSVAGLQWQTRLPWIPAIGASYHVAVDGLSLPLILLTNLLMLVVMLYVLRRQERTKEHTFLFFVMQTGLLGVFSAQDLLLFYLFFEVALVPMYFIIGIWGGEQRRYAAMKFFLYTRAGSLAMLLSFLALYLKMDPHSFSLPAIAAANPFAGSVPAAGLVLLGLLIGFGVKMPTFPLHNWLPDAHVEAPTEGSVILAGVQLKMGGYGVLRVMIPCLPETVQQYVWVLVVLALISLIYGALAALAQKDLKRLVAYTSVNHMGYVMLGAAAWALAADPSVRQLALNGAAYQMVSHGLLTGGMFLIVGILQHKAETREMDRFGGLLGKIPIYSTLLGLLAFGSLGLPGFSGFVAEFQVIGAAVGVNVWLAVLTVLSLIITTGLYIRIIVNVVMGEAPKDMPALSEPNPRELIAVTTLLACSLWLGILPGPLTDMVEQATRFLTGL